MAKSSSIEWTEITWNPVLGCDKVSKGCANCYAEIMAKRLAAIASAQAAKGLNPGRASHYQRVVNEKGRWSGVLYPVEEALEDPLKWKGRKKVFVNSMSDLFHEQVPVEFIHRVFNVMNRCPQHSFQILTKRSHRLLEISNDLPWGPNIWVGTSVENDKVLGRVHDLKKTPAMVRFLSVEPLLGPILELPLDGIHWVIVGGESGPNARPMDRKWVINIRDQCLEAGVPFFFKQWGGKNKKAAGRELDGSVWNQMPNQLELAYA